MKESDNCIYLKYIVSIGLIALFVCLGSFTRSEPLTRQGTTEQYLQFSIPGGMLIAGDDGMLHARAYQPPANLMSAARLNELHRKHLQDVINASKVLFPESTKVQSVDVGGASPIEVNFNRAFINPRFWRRHKTMKLAVYSIVNNIGNKDLPKGPPLPVQILVEGKRVDAINSFDIRKPRKPDMSIVVQ